MNEVMYAIRRILVGALLGLIVLFMGGAVKALAEDPYTIIKGGTSTAGAVRIQYGTNYVMTLTGQEHRYLKFTTPAQKGCFSLKGKNLSYQRQFRFRIVNAQQEEIASECYWIDKEERITNFLLEPSTTYYLEACAAAYGNDNIPGNVRFSVYYSPDAQGDTWKDAVPVKVNTLVTASMDGGHDNDCFCFIPGKTGEYTFSAVNQNMTGRYNHGIVVSITSEYNETVLAKQEITTSARSDIFTVSLSANVKYYVNVYLGGQLDNSALLVNAHWDWNQFLGKAVGTYQLGFSDGTTKTLSSIDISKAYTASTTPVDTDPGAADAPASSSSGSTATSGKGTSSSKGTSSAPAKGTEWKTAAAVYVVTKKGSEVSYKKPTGKRKTVTIPATVKWNGITYKVTGIEKSAFSRNTTVTKITVGKNVRTIGKYAFFRTKNLKSLVILTKNLTASRIGKSAFTQAGAANYKKLTVKVPASKKKAYTALFRKKGLSKKAAVK